MKDARLRAGKYSPSESQKFRNKWLKKGYELINITTLCEFKLGTSGWCNDFNEADETIHHVQVWYREEQVATLSGLTGHVIDDARYILFNTNEDDFTGADFIIFKKVKK